MDELRQQLLTFPSLDDLKATTYAQILALSERKEGLQKISTDITDLIARYNAQKSYLGHAAHWYGELNWWLKIIVSTVAVGVAILLTVPWVISIALSLVASFLLMNHYEVTQARNRLICTDLNEQNKSVQSSLDLLNDTKKKLEKSLESLCKLTIEMGAENQKLRTNVDAITQKSEEYQKKTIQLESTIQALQEKNELLSTQVFEAQNQLNNYGSMLINGTLIYTNANASLQKTAAETKNLVKKMSSVSDKFAEAVNTLTALPYKKHSSDSDNEDRDVLEDALELLRNLKSLENTDLNENASTYSNRL